MPTATELPPHWGWSLTEEQLDGLHCIYCDQPAGAMRPVYQGPRGQLFRHPECDPNKHMAERDRLAGVTQG